MFSRPLVVSSRLLSSASRRPITVARLSSHKPVAVASSQLCARQPVSCVCCSSIVRSLSFSSYGRHDTRSKHITHVNGQDVDASNIVPGPKSQKYEKDHAEEFETDNVGYNTENDKQIKQASDAYMSPDKNNLSEEIMENGENDADHSSGQERPTQHVESELSRNSTINASPSKLQKKASSSRQQSSSFSTRSSSSSSSKSSRVPAPSDSEAIVHAEREFKDVDPLNVENSTVADSNDGKMDVTTPLSHGQNSRDRSVKDDDSTTVGRARRERHNTDDDSTPTNIPSS